MSLSDIKSRRGFPKKEATCDDCGTTEIVSAERGKNGEGQARIKLQKHGWSSIGGVDRCADCETLRKGTTEMNQSPKITADTPVREPTRAQKRQIMEILDEVYDVDAGRYKGQETDITVAQTLENGIMPGWVAQLREEFFGPAATNEDLDEIYDDLKDRMTVLEKQATEIHDQIQTCVKSLRDLNSHKEEVQKLFKRIEAIKKVLGPKVERL